MDQKDEDMGETTGTMVTALAWVSRGFAKPMLDNYEPDAKDLAKHQKLQKKIAKDKNSEEMRKVTKQVEEDLANMDIDSDSEEVDVPIFTSELARLKAKETGQDLDDADEQMEDGADEVNDPYPEAFSDSEEEKEDYTIRKSDSIIVAATAENDHSNLEIYIYEHEHSNLYVHHEIILGSYPLCIEWLSYFQEQKTNLMIVGTFSPEIEVWNLDSENCEPVFVLGSFDESEKRKKLVKNFKKQPPIKESIPEDTHTDAVMSLSLNQFEREYLLSGSADKTVRVWDLEETQCKAVYSDLHSDKVQAVRWNRVNKQVFASGGYDGHLNLVDVRDPSKQLQYKLSKKIYQDIESLQWHAQSEFNFICTTESGHVVGFDTRAFSQPIFSIQAHEKACSAASFSPHVSNMLATVGTDQVCKIWDIQHQINGKAEPKLIMKKDLKQGELFSVQFYDDIPWVLAAGGSKGEVAIWDTEESEAIEKHFKPFLSPDAPKEPKAVVVEDDGNSDFEDLSDEAPVKSKPKKSKKD